MAGATIPVWLDCDTGHDDAYAILLAAHHPSIRLLGVSTVHGNASLDHTFENSRAVLHAIARPGIPVLKGSATPISRPPCHAVDIHGESGIDGVTLLPKLPPSPPDLTIAAHDQIASAILAQPPDTVHLIATGPLTNVYHLIRLHPEVITHLAGLSVMGGALGGGFTDAPLGTVEGEGERFGNWTPWAEFNIYADPDAANAVLSNPELACKTTLIPLDLTHLVRGHTKVQDFLFGPQHHHDGALSVTRQLFRQVLMFFHGTYKTQFGIMDGPPLHDPVAVYVVACPQAFGDNGGERWSVVVRTDEGRYDRNADPQNHSGQTIATPATSGVRIPRSVDLDAFWASIDDALTVVERELQT